MSGNEMTLNQMSAHLAWCALVALGLAKREGRALGKIQEHLFLFAWLKQAMRQKRFPKVVAPDLCWLIEQGEKNQASAHLKDKLQYLHDSGTGKLTDKNDLYRLTTILGTLSQMCLPYSLLSEDEWRRLDDNKLNVNIDYLRIRKATLDKGFTECGSQISPVEVVLTGRVEKVEALLASCNWTLSQPKLSQKLRYQLIASPD